MLKPDGGDFAHISRSFLHLCPACGKRAGDVGRYEARQVVAQLVAAREAATGSPGQAFAEPDGGMHGGSGHGESMRMMR